MKIKYKVIKVDAPARGLDVHYYTDAYPTGVVLHVTLYPDPIPTGQELEDYILARAPAAWLEMKGKAPADLSGLLHLVGVEKVAEHAVVAEATTTTLQVKVL